MKKRKTRWVHSCHKVRQDLVLQEADCPYCGRIRTPQAEQKYTQLVVDGEISESL